MAEVSTAIYALNGGEVGPDIIARFDLDRLRFAATTMENFISFKSGKMQLRPGFQNLMAVTNGNSGFWFPFYNTNNLSFLIHFMGPTIRIYSVTQAGATVNATVTGAPWSASQAANIKATQINDVLFIASEQSPRKLEFRGGSSWILSEYQPDDGPFDIGPEEQPFTLTPSALTGNSATITSSASFFSSGDVGKLLRLRTVGVQNVAETLGSSNTVSASIRVFGNNEETRRFRAGFAVDPRNSSNGRLILEQSVGDESSWRSYRTWSVSAVTITEQNTNNQGDADASASSDTTSGSGSTNQVDTSTSVNLNSSLETETTVALNLERGQSQEIFDDIPNVAVYYRFRYETSETERQAVFVNLSYASGSTEGVARITSRINSTSARVNILKPFGATRATSDWDEGSWSGTKGWPTSVAYHSGRLMWGRRNQVFASESDRFENFDDNVEGDATAFTRSVLSKSTNGVLWLLDNQRLIAGAQNTVSYAWASSFSENLTASDFTSRIAVSVGAAPYQGEVLDSETVFLDNTRRRLYILRGDGQNDYQILDTTEINRDILEPGVASFAIQRQPETRIWCSMSDGTMRCLTYEPSENVLAWSRITTVGNILQVRTLPGPVQDHVLIVYQNTRGQTFLERLRPFSDAEGGANSLMQDHDTGSSYTGRWQSTKLAYGAGAPNTALGAEKRVHHLGLYMLNTRLSSVKIGPSFNDTHDLARTQLGRPINFNTVHEEFTAYPQPFGGKWDIDSRICIEVQSPNPCTIAALVVGMDTNASVSSERRRET